ncbi:VCBS repeat-containing protein [bacterium]|nr:VCBS repeat-containing protein [bacterium]
MCKKRSCSSLILSFTAFTMLLVFPFTASPENRTVIRHHGFEDFSKGTFGDSGANIYVSKAGGIQLINRWDLNNDGFLDLLINQDHNSFETVDAFIYHGTKNGFHSLFPSAWKQLPAYKLFTKVNETKQYMDFLPTFGGGPCKVGDFNHDGYTDIVFVNIIHNYTYNTSAYLYLGSPEGFSVVHRQEIPTYYAQDVEAADLNRDGYPDLVFANYGYEWGKQRGYRHHLESYVYWGSPELYSKDRRISLPTVSATSCTAGDFDGDGWTDLAFANADPQPGVYVYLNKNGSFSADNRLEIQGDRPLVVRSGDVNADGIDDLMVCSSGKGIDLYPGCSPFRLEKAYTVPAQRVRDIKVKDVNRDGNVDLICASSITVSDTLMFGHSENSYAVSSSASQVTPTVSEIFWGSKKGFSPDRCLLLPSNYPQAVDVADLNGDSYDDIVFANFGFGNNNDVPSFIYWGSEDGYDPSCRTHIQGFGADGVASADFDRDGMTDVLLMNQISQTSPVPSVVYWGNPAHYYSEAASTFIPCNDPYYSKVADLNDDGYVDIVFGGFLSIAWGSASGFREHTDFNFHTLGVTVQDFNRDGFLDIGVNAYENGAKGYIIWGSPQGYSLDKKTLVTDKNTANPWGVTTADLNRDGCLDIVYASGDNPKRSTEIVWGTPQGYENTTSTFLNTNRVESPAIADLDGNGWLDLIFPGGVNLDTLDYHSPSLIYWGSATGYSEDRRSELEAYASFEVSVDDLNRDGFLDIVASNYQAESTRHVPIYIYWGNAQHTYGNQNRTELPGQSSAGIELLDLNSDDFPDIIVTNHIEHGDHSIESYIYWGSPDGYSVGRRTSLPTIGPHFLKNIDKGNIYNRSPFFDYISPPIILPDKVKRVTVEWTGETPHNTDIRFEYRSAADEAGLAKAKWLTVTSGKPFSPGRGAQFIQYRAVFISPDGGSSPVLKEVVLTCE